MTSNQTGTEQAGEDFFVFLISDTTMTSGDQTEDGICSNEQNLEPTNWSHSVGLVTVTL